MSKTLSIVIPALNEEEGIGKTIEAIPRQKLEQMGFSVQILVIDNGSKDRTAEFARQAGADVILESKRGYGRAYKTGFAKAKGDVIVTGDADCSYPMEEIPRLVDVLVTEGLDFITTNRFADMDKDAMSVGNRFGNCILNAAVRLLFFITITDSQSGMLVFHKSMLDKMVLRSDGMPLSEEIKLEACYFARARWKELPIKYRARVGQVKLRVWRDGGQNLFYLVRKRIAR